MSLLLDALKRAEEAKRAKQSSDRAEPVDAVSPELPLEQHDADPIADANVKALEELLAPAAPATPAAAARTTRPSRQPLALSLEEVRPVIAAQSQPEPVAETTASLSTGVPKQEKASPEAARTVFAAKQRPGVMAAASSKPWLLPALAGLIVLLGAGAWYVWTEISKLTRPSSPIAIRNSAPPAPAPLAPMPAATGQPQPGKVTEPVAVVVAQDNPLPPLLPPELKEAAPTATAKVADGLSGPPLTEREAYAKRIKEAPLAPEPAVALKLARSVQPDAVHPELMRAYEALRNGDFETARALYQRRVQTDPLSLDAQLGLATVGARTGDRALANRHYRDALAIDPRNETAIAGVLAISGNGSVANQETQLRTMLGQNPSASSLHFSLGNLLASQNRWVEAQQAYFEAYRLHADVADHAYNLAVSLDHLGQARLAREYYLKALDLQPRSRGQFDTAAVAGRVQELTGSDKAP